MSGTLTAGALSVAGISSSGALIGPYVTATSTTATSTFAGEVNVAGVAGLSVLQNGSVVIGTTSPTNDQAGLTMIGSNSASKILEIHNNFAVGADFYTHSNTGFRGPFLALKRSRGDQLAPTAVQTSDALGGITFSGHDGSKLRRRRFHHGVADRKLVPVRLRLNAHLFHCSCRRNNARPEHDRPKQWRRN